MYVVDAGLAITWHGSGRPVACVQPFDASCDWGNAKRAALMALQAAWTPSVSTARPMRAHCSAIAQSATAQSVTSQASTRG